MNFFASKDRGGCVQIIPIRIVRGVETSAMTFYRALGGWMCSDILYQFSKLVNIGFELTQCPQIVMPGFQPHNIALAFCLSNLSYLLKKTWRDPSKLE